MQEQKEGFSRHLPFWMLAAGLLCVLALLLFGGSESTAQPPAFSLSPPALTPLPAPAGLRIAVASDTHLDPDNTDKTGQLGETVYNLEIVEAMLYDAQAQGAQLLLLTGDLCNSGKPNKHEALVEKLRAAEAAGLTVYVLPGNHDLAPIRQKDFAALYAEFGYSEAYSRDETSLSYCILRDDLMLLMMDTAGYGAGAIDLPGAAVRENNDAFLSEATLRWAEEMLRQALERDLPVLAAGHYNLLPEISRTPGSGFYVENGERFAALLRRCGVPLYLSGHMHLRAVYEEEGLTEQLTECLIAYPTGYTLLDLTAEALTVAHRRVDVDAWAAETGQADPVLLDFAAWQQQALYDYCCETVSAMARRNAVSREDTERAVRFFYAVMDAYWSGTLAARQDALERMDGYGPFFRCAEGYSFGWWLKDLIDSASPLQAGYTLKR